MLQIVLCLPSSTRSSEGKQSRTRVLVLFWLGARSGSSIPECFCSLQILSWLGPHRSSFSLPPLLTPAFQGVPEPVPELCPPAPALLEELNECTGFSLWWGPSLAWCGCYLLTPWLQSLPNNSYVYHVHVLSSLLKVAEEFSWSFGIYFSWW